MYVIYLKFEHECSLYFRYDLQGDHSINIACSAGEICKYSPVTRQGSDVFYYIKPYHQGKYCNDFFLD